jgi:hypothetical protein
MLNTEFTLVHLLWRDDLLCKTKVSKSYWAYQKNKL